jgi:hypothetical protein
MRISLYTLHTTINSLPLAHVDHIVEVFYLQLPSFEICLHVR